MKRTLKYLGIILLVLVAALAITVGIYCIYLQAHYYRFPDNTSLKVDNQQAAQVATDTDYTAVTYNIGFGAYDHDFSFFMDSGTMLDGTKVQGTESRATGKDVVENDIAGAISAVSAADPDFVLLQEVDSKATRSYDVNEQRLFRDAFPEDASVFAINFHSSFLLYPVSKPHGTVNAGLLTMSRYAIDSASRRSYPIDESFPAKFFDLDRCFSVQRLSVEDGRELVLVNSHMSAYDKGGIIRDQQLAVLNAFLADEQAKDNYVIVGGDFNHALCGTIDTFPSEQYVPNWIVPLDQSEICDGYTIVEADNVSEVATCRSTDIPYTAGVNYTVVIDGFIVSGNVQASAENIDTDFSYSDHNPVKLTFRLL